MKRIYKRPTMKVVQLKHRTQMLQASVQDRQSSVQDYGMENYYEE